MDAHATILIDVGRREKILDFVYVEPRLLLDFATHALLHGFVHVAEAAWQVERPLGRFLGAAHYEQLVVLVDDKSSGGGAGVRIVDEPAVVAPLALEVVFHPVCTPTHWAEFEFI